MVRIRYFNGELLYRLRNKKHLSYEEMAIDLNTLATNIEGYEKGHLKPTYTMAERLARYFNVELSKFTNIGNTSDTP